MYGRLGEDDRTDRDSASVAESLLVETGVATVPGEAFGTPGFLRLNFSVDDEIFAEGADRIRGWFDPT
jgi:aspartate/methionine/tyrosine aminotransferase